MADQAPEDPKGLKSEWQGWTSGPSGGFAVICRRRDRIALVRIAGRNPDLTVQPPDAPEVRPCPNWVPFGTQPISCACASVRGGVCG